MGMSGEEKVEDMEEGVPPCASSSLRLSTASRLWAALGSFLCPPEDAAASTSKPVNLRLLLWRFCRVAAAFFQGDAKWKARGLMAILVVFAVSATGMNVLISYNQRDTTNALTEKKPGEFYAAVFKFMAICAFAAPFFGLYDYVQGLMSLEWRVWLTDLLLAKYFGKKAFFDLKMAGVLDNPDQRICEDVAHFVNSSVSVIILLVEKVLNVFAFSAVLWSISPGIVTFLLLYAIVGTLVSLRVFGKKLMWLRFEGLQREADMRYSLVRVRDNVESIAFYRGEHREAASVQSFLLLVVQNIRQQLIWNFGLGVFTNAYNYATFMIPVLALAPSFFAGKIEYGDIVQTSIAFDQIFGAVTIIVLRLEMWTSLAAETERLESLLSALKVYSGDDSLSIASLLDDIPAPDGPDSPGGTPGGKGSKANGRLGKASGGLEDQIPLVDLPANRRRNSSSDPSADSPHPTIHSSVGPTLVVKDLTITLPRSGEVLFPQGLSFALAEGQSLLVMGPSGCGKSSLLRVISGLWSTGTGSVQCPRDKDLFFLPQKPYMTIGSLRDQLLFPLAASTQGEALDTELVRVLQDVHLPDLVKRFTGGLDEECDWSDTLSVGEQQRIAFARLLVRRPQMAFLDEATSALDTANERNLYALMRRHVSSFVSVGHRASLLAFHTHVLFFDEDRCVWKLVPASEHNTQLPGAG